jgi:hypothetical protein
MNKSSSGWSHLIIIIITTTTTITIIIIIAVLLFCISFCLYISNFSSSVCIDSHCLFSFIYQTSATFIKDYFYIFRVLFIIVYMFYCFIYSLADLMKSCLWNFKEKYIFPFIVQYKNNASKNIHSITDRSRILSRMASLGMIDKVY